MENLFSLFALAAYSLIMKFMPVLSQIRLICMNITTTFSSLTWLKHVAFLGKMILPLYPSWIFFSYYWMFILVLILAWFFVRLQGPSHTISGEHHCRNQSPLVSVEITRGMIITAKCDSGFCPCILPSTGIWDCVMVWEQILNNVDFWIAGL